MVVCAAGVATVNALIALFGDHHAELGELTQSQRVRLFFWLMTGPFAGWAMAAGQRQLFSGLPMLITASLLSMIPLALYFAKGGRVTLGLAAIFWIATGYLFCVAIWI